MVKKYLLKKLQEGGPCCLDFLPSFLEFSFFETVLASLSFPWIY